MNGGWGISYEIALRWMPLDLTDDKATLVQVMAWCREATSHYLSQCWPKSMSPNGVTRPQWVKWSIIWDIAAIAGLYIYGHGGVHCIENAISLISQYVYGKLCWSIMMIYPSGIWTIDWPMVCGHCPLFHAKTFNSSRLSQDWYKYSMHIKTQFRRQLDCW